MNHKISKDPIFSMLGMNSDWLEIGIITNDNFWSIKEEYLRGEDNNTEHYRWGAFNKFFKFNDPLESEIFYRLYNLGKNDPDLAMGRD